MISLIVAVFIIGYLAIAFEHQIKINKAATAILTGVLCWTLYVLFFDNHHQVTEQLSYHLGEISEILFFLMGAMTVVELIDAHDGFEVITRRIHTNNQRVLLWIVCILCFLLSSVLDNLTTTIVMVSLIRKIISDTQTRLLFIGMLIIAANAGGAWSPLGDVTTTMLWIGGQITPINIMIKLIVPSIVCMAVPLAIASFRLRGAFVKPEKAVHLETEIPSRDRTLIFFVGIGALVFVPFFKTFTHLPPYMGVLFGLGVLWLITELIHGTKDEEDKDALSVVSAIRKIDMPSILFFLGILLAIAVLQETGTLAQLATFMDQKIGNINVIVILIGFISAIIDNVPIVAATMGMYNLTDYPPDSYLWEFIALCAGTGGSMLIIGSAAGVAAMGMEKIDFFWYLKNIGWLALLGYIAGSLVYILQETLFHL